jgi:phytanoyl-CoA hydroxylase
MSWISIGMYCNNNNKHCFHCRARFLDICEGRVARDPRITLMRDLQLAKANITGERATYKVQDFVTDDILFGFCQLPQVIYYIFIDYILCYLQILNIVEDIIGGPNLLAMHTMLINKPPDLGTS